MKMPRLTKTMLMHPTTQRKLMKAHLEVRKQVLIQQLPSAVTRVHIGKYTLTVRCNKHWKTGKLTYSVYMLQGITQQVAVTKTIRDAWQVDPILRELAELEDLWPLSHTAFDKVIAAGNAEALQDLAS